MQIRAVTEAPDPHQLEDLCALLIDAVEGGASLGFLKPLDEARARTYWEGVSKAVQAGDKALLVAEIGGAILGTVQVVLDMPQNQPHRSEISKMIVHTRVRQLGLGMRLLEAAEERARFAGKSLMMLDTQTGSAAEHLYKKAGYSPLPPLPDYALTPDGELAPTTIFWKRI
ncbi:GNAT family N-acetyltransferase [Aquidulcibacter sp.]|jgi:GNAT superfamily N-acetyltransferase|uniref:GNAT family N-acetyltransferase n=1 Tax=Aquidulcibacter sp. TaxID=2052990 RepID=UPI0028B248BB|nr:GNAT family N-acetyltransferase [Aquidulcibacter sp.]